MLPDSNATIYPDEFHDLDNGGTVRSISDLSTTVTNKVSKARSAYFLALSCLEQADTSCAVKQFERSIRILHDVANEPGIQRLTDYSRLINSVIYDYERSIRSIGSLDTDASISILRERLLADHDQKAPVEPVAGVKPKPPVKQSTQTTIALPVNEDVEKSIEFLTVAKGRPFMKRWLERSGRWFPTLRRIAREEEMPEEIIYLAMMESGLNPNAQSWAKAVGMWQFIASTGEMYDLKITPWVDERRDPEKATRAAMRFLKDLYNDLGDWHLALAAYNCGPGGVRRAKRRAGMPDGNYWDIRNHLPRETRNYVPLYIATTLVTMNPDNYDFPPDSLQFHSPHLYDTFLVPEAVNISALAQCAGISVDSLKLLNPELIRPCTPPNETYRLKIPVGTREMVTRNFAQLTTEEKQPWVTHTVRKRETLAAVSRLYGVSVADLAAINGISGYKSRLRVGSKLRVPVQSAEERTENNTQQIAPPAASQVAQKSEPTKPNVRTHIVAEGESLTTIARKFGVTVADLQSWNNIARQNETILPGDQLVVGYTDQPSENLKVERIRVQKVVTHKVKRGETLAELASRYGTTVAEIRRLNKMKRNHNLRYGTSIKVETSVVTTRMVAGQKSNSTPASAPPQTYTVQKGDTISSICARTGISVASLRELNPSLKKSDVVRIGQRLRLQ